MRHIDKPNFEPVDVYRICISRVRNIGLRTRFENITGIVSESAIEYDSKAINGTLYLLEEHDDVDGVSRSEMEKIYTNRMVNRNSPGRAIYDSLKTSAPLGICPLCGHRPVSTLDHYLPKANFPAYAVLPYNLLPACSDCNKIKSDDTPENEDEQTLHPYYDNVTNEQWLFGKVNQTIPVSINFYVEPPEHWDNILSNRVLFHFKTFELCALYSLQAANELANMNLQLCNLFECGEEEAVAEHLNEAAQSRQRNHVNSWQTAMYQAMANSVWFCNGGFI